MNPGNQGGEEYNRPTTPVACPSSTLRLVLVGRKRAGKSATGNTILGGEYFRSQVGVRPVTKTCQGRFATVRSRHLLVVDTPGFSKAEMSQDAVKHEVQRCHELCAPGPHVLLLIVPLGRFTEDERQAVEAIQQLFSPYVPNRTILIFTRADELQGKSIKDFISEQDGSIQELVNRFNRRFLAINNRDPGDTQQVDSLLSMVDNLCSPTVSIPGRCTTPLRLVLVGRTGTGKSATGNTILGEGSFASEFSMKSVTQVCESKSGTVQGRSLVMVDTPGLFDTSLSQDVVQREVVRCLTFSSPGPHALLLTVSLNGLTEEELKCIDIIEEMFQDEVRRYIILVFTYADYLHRTTIQDFVRQDPDIMELVKRFDGRYVAFNNKETHDPSQVTKLLEEIDRLVASNGYQHFSNHLSRAIEKAVAELLNEANADRGTFKKFYSWCRAHPYIAILIAGAAVGLGAGVPLAMGAMAPAAVVEVGLGAQIWALIAAEDVAIKAIIAKLVADGVLAGGTGVLGAALASCCVQ